MEAENWPATTVTPDRRAQFLMQVSYAMGLLDCIRRTAAWADALGVESGIEEYGGRVMAVHLGVRAWSRSASALATRVRDVAVHPKREAFTDVFELGIYERGARAALAALRGGALLTLIEVADGFSSHLPSVAVEGLSRVRALRR